MYPKIIKPLLDFSLAFIAILLLSPFFILITLFLFIANKGKPFFLQRRPGKNEKIFTIIKFKTMNDKKDKKGNLLPDDQRLTKVGKFVRATSLDEIPQLLNVIKGDMSLVGPRPLLPEYLPLYNDSQKQRHQLKPGITGWTQVNGRNAISWEKKLELDVVYVEEISLLLDIKILFKTIKKVFIREGINMQGEVTTSSFKGNNELI
ncbi:MAG: lipid carrier--UDP-N-acetylgalactosaminyltransferase [Flavobacterium sp.]|nr:MAG: lipid carrier--UDP-N-acetylgalactosaminyltransferase [Flavobacterium sp.]